MIRETAYRFAIFDRPQAPWRRSREEAEADAIDAGLATADEAPDGRELVWLTVPAEIWITDEVVGATPRCPRRRRKKGPTCSSSLTRIERAIERREAQISANY